MNADQIVGEKVHILMRRAKMSQEQLGTALGITQAAAGRKLAGARKWTMDELYAAARFLDVDVADILPENDYAPILEGRGRVVRPERLELPTFWMGAGDGFWTAERSAEWESLTSELTEAVAS